MVPPKVFLITTGAENRMQAGGLLTVLATFSGKLPISIGDATGVA